MPDFYTFTEVAGRESRAFRFDTLKFVKAPVRDEPPGSRGLKRAAGSSWSAAMRARRAKRREPGRSIRHRVITSSGTIYEEVVDSQMEKIRFNIPAAPVSEKTVWRDIMINDGERAVTPAEYTNAMGPIVDPSDIAILDIPDSIDERTGILADDMVNLDDEPEETAEAPADEPDENPAADAIETVAQEVTATIETVETVEAAEIIETVAEAAVEPEPQPEPEPAPIPEPKPKPVPTDPKVQLAEMLLRSISGGGAAMRDRALRKVAFAQEAQPQAKPQPRAPMPTQKTAAASPLVKPGNPVKAAAIKPVASPRDTSRPVVPERGTVYAPARKPPKPPKTPT